MQEHGSLALEVLMEGKIGDEKDRCYRLWAFSMLGICGIHRLHMRFYATGVLWILTGGCFGFGQIIDFFRMPALMKKAKAHGESS